VARATSFERALLSPPRVQAAWTITPAAGAVRPLIVRIRVRSLINAWSAVCLVLIGRSRHGGASSNTTLPLWDWQGCTAMPLGVGHSLDVRQWVCQEEGRSDLVGGFV
jgi:hypothetical protein